MRKIFLNFFLCLLISLLSCVNAQDASEKELDKKIDKIFASFDDPEKPGAAVSVVRNGKIVFKKGYGSAQLEYGIPVSPATIFHIASVSKQFTAFSILLLEAEGKLSFDDDIRKHIPEVPDFGETITLRHLASHTSGMRDQWELLSMAGWRWDDVITKEHIMRLVARQQDLNFQPGEKYTYCNTGFTLLAEVVARISGKSFAEFTEERIFKPLDMKSTLFYDDHEKIVPNRAYSYYATGEGYKKSVLNYANVGATSLFTTVEDLALWAMNFQKPKVGSSEIFDKMNTLATLNDGSTFGGAYGQFVNTHKGLKQIQHGGADAGYRSYLGRFPEQDIAVMVFSNLAQSNPNSLALQVADLFLADFIKEDPKLKTQKQKAPKFISLDKDKLEAFCGDYWNEKDMYGRTIYLRNDTLWYMRNVGNESPLAPLSKNKFQMLNVGVDLTVSFKKENGEKQMVVVINDGAPILSEEYVRPDYDEKKLGDFLGQYYSPELDTYYEITEKNGGLVLTHNRNNDTELSPLKADLFEADFGGIIKFQRNEQEKINGYKVSSGRVSHVWFERVEQK